MVRALLAVSRAIAEAVQHWRASASRRPMVVEISVLQERCERLRAENALLRSRMRRIAPRHRTHYLASERLAILEHAARFGLSIVATARAFLVSVGTVLNWRKDVAKGLEGVVRGKSPANTLPEFVAEVARRLKREWPQWGTRRIAGILARLGLKASRTSVQAFLRRKPMRPAKSQALRPTRRSRLVAKYPGHVWFIDFTRVGGFLRSVVVGAVIDGFSRKVLALRVAPREPTAAFAVRLVRDAVRDFGAPRHLVSDRGTQMTAAEFVRALRRRGIRHRYGAVRRHVSVALIECFWKSFKVEFARGLVLYGPLARIQARAASYACWFNAHRPHQGLGQRTPDEVHFGRDTKAKAVPLHAALCVEHVDGERGLPVLSLRRAA